MRNWPIKHVSDDEAKDAAKKVMNTIEKVVISERHSMSHIAHKKEARSVVNSHGITIYFSKTPWSYRGYYDGEAGRLRFTNDAAWDEFLHAYYSYSKGTLNFNYE